MPWTIPNLLSVIRVIAAPCVALAFALLDRPDADRIALAIFIGAALTDYFDGSLARSLGQESAFGRMLDPVADKAMVTISLVVLSALFGLHWTVLVPASLIVLREVLISGLREFLGDVKLPVTRMAKWKTTLQMFAIGLLLSYGAVQPMPGHEPANRIVAEVMQWASVGLGALGMVVLWSATWFTIVTGWDYVRRGLPYIQAKETPAPKPAAEPGE